MAPRTPPVQAAPIVLSSQQIASRWGPEGRTMDSAATDDRDRLLDPHPPILLRDAVVRHSPVCHARHPACPSGLTGTGQLGVRWIRKNVAGVLLEASPGNGNKSTSQLASRSLTVPKLAVETSVNEPAALALHIAG